MAKPLSPTTDAMRFFKYIASYLCLLALLSSCKTYYQQNLEFHQYFERGNFLQAEKVLEKNRKAAKSNHRLLYYLNLGTSTFMAGNYELANKYFEEAYQIGDDLSKNYFQEAAALLINPNIAPYRGESFELVLMHYYKALSFLKIGNYEAALVECRRMNIRLLALSDSRVGDKKYREDAFFHLLMGIIYDANQEYNNAFIAYRNSLNIFEKSYTEMFGVPVPEQLKRDLIRTAHLSGLDEERQQYEEAFGLSYEPLPPNTGSLVFFWHNGLGPIKAENALEFAMARRNGQMNFNNPQFRNNNFRFDISDDDYNSSGLIGLDVVRVVLPKYVERPSYFQRASLRFNGQEYPLELGQNLTAIAFKTLQERMATELAKSLLRTALKKAAEYKLKKEKDGIGELFGLFAQFTEQADTRAWQTIPSSLHYARIALPEGKQRLQLLARGRETDQLDFQFEIVRNKTVFHFFHHMQTALPRSSPR